MYHEIYLPFPPSDNNYYRKSHHGGRFISEKGRLFRDQVAKAISEQCPDVHITEPILVEVVLFPPDNRMRDIANYNKALMDAITLGGFWEDDSLINQLFMYRGEVRQRNGSCYIRVTDGGPLISNINQLPDS